MQIRLWRAITVRAVLLGLCYLFEGITFGVLVEQYQAIMKLLSCILVVLITESSFCRKSPQVYLTKLFHEYRQTAAAAGIACLVGDASTKEVMTKAADNFRCVPASAITLEALMNRSPDPSLFQLSRPAKLGKCDAFISHSWSDDAQAKFAALQRWSDDFAARTGREANIWVDKYCINQQDIEASLLCLPVFVSGCRRFVALSGSSYLQRLWCVMELFTYVHMGCDMAKMELVPLVRDGSEAADMTQIRETFRDFNVEDCECSVQSDKDHMLEIIQMAFGGMHGFNYVVQDVLRSARLHADSSTWEDGSHEDDPSLEDGSTSSSDESE
mmetsp:Transcript_100920/g.260837  ORF Transcript_100920/g.260837 Transcript_100920/m.260837 type:complete len:328 (-) Transcript_100920:84-1067(-)